MECFLGNYFLLGIFLEDLFGVDCIVYQGGVLWKDLFGFYNVVVYFGVIYVFVGWKVYLCFVGEQFCICRTVAQLVQGWCLGELDCIVCVIWINFYFIYDYYNDWVRCCSGV